MECIYLEPEPEIKSDPFPRRSLKELYRLFPRLEEPIQGILIGLSAIKICLVDRQADCWFSTLLNDHIPMPLQQSLKQLILVTGPARSGKSVWAENLALKSGRPVIYIATAQLDSSDTEWQARIEKHRQRRPSSWKTVDVPVDLAATIQTSPATTCLLVDSLGTWLANCLEQPDDTWNDTMRTLIDSLSSARCDVILVAEETGWGVVPAYVTGRRFRDRLGSVTHQIGRLASSVYLVTAGHALNLSDLGTPLPD